MTAIERTAYPRFKRILSAKDLEEVYTPTPAERFLALRSTKGTVAEIGFLVLLKTHQRLGRFIPLNEVPFSILNHIIKLAEPSLDIPDLETYDTSGTRQRHIPLIRAAREIQQYSPAARTCALKAMIGVARTKGLNTNIGDTRGKIAILLEVRRRLDVNCRLPQCFRSLEEKSPPLNRLGSLDPQTLGHVESNEPIGIDITVDQWSQPAQILFGHLTHPGWL